MSIRTLDKIRHTPGSGIAKNTPVLVGGQLFISAAAIAAGEPGTLIRFGVFESVAKTTGEAWTENQKLYWVTGTSKLTTTVGSNAYAGRAYATAASGDETGTIALNAPKG